MLEESRLDAEGESVNALAITKSNEPKGNIEARRKQNKKNSKKDVECYRCPEGGHFASECPQKNHHNIGDLQTGKSRGGCAFVVERLERDRQSRTWDDPYRGPSVEQVQQLLRMDTKDNWFTDSGASSHRTFRQEWFSEFHATSGDTVSLGDDGECNVTGIGTINVQSLVNGIWEDSVIEDVLFVPRVKKDLFSVGVCATKGFSVRKRKCRDHTKWRD